MKGQIVSKFDLGLLNARNTIYFDRNITENKEWQKNEGSHLSCVTNCEFIFSNVSTYKSFGICIQAQVGELHLSK